MHDCSGQFEGRAVVITGGLGFIGSTLAHRLVAAGAMVTVVDTLVPEHGGNAFNLAGSEDRVRVVASDIRDQAAMEAVVTGADFLFHLAGQTSHLDSMRDPLLDLDLNCRGSLTILEACRKENPGIRIVYASTRQIYGAPRYLPVNESHPLDPVDANGISKMAAERYHMLGHLHGMRVCSLRLTNTYGPRMRIKDDRQTFIGLWIRRLLEGEDIVVYGDGSQLRDLNYVDDVVTALLLSVSDNRAVGKTFNLGGTPPLSLNELARLMISIHGSGTMRMEPFPAQLKRIDIGSYYGDASLIQNELGWNPVTSLEDGLKKTFAYFRERWKQYV